MGCRKFIVPTQNRFDPLIVNDAEETIGLENRGYVPNKRQNIPQSTPAPNRRQNTDYVSTGIAHKQVKIVPGNKPYNKAHIRPVSIVTDSMCRSIRNADFNKDIQDVGIKNVECKFHKFPGASAQQIRNYSKFNILEDNTHGLVVVSGTNSLRTIPGKQELTDREIADSILQTGIDGQKEGVKKVFISGIILRKGSFYQKRILNINLILRNECLRQGFVFIDQSNILFEHLHEDGLHLNHEGTCILKQNILKALY